MNRSLPLFFVLMAGFLIGCSSGGSGVPVTGKVTHEGKALTAGNVAFWPDAAKGNKHETEAVGQIDASGTYTVTTRGKTAVLPGWYKVTVNADAPPSEKDPYALPKSLIPVKYKDVATSNLQVEVVREPAAGAYDLKLTN